MANVSQAGSVELHFQIDPTVGGPLFRYTGDHFFDNHGFFCFIPSLGAWHKYCYHHQVTPGGQNDNPLLETVARAQGQTS